MQTTIALKIIVLKYLLWKVMREFIDAMPIKLAFDMLGNLFALMIGLAMQ